VISTGAAGGAEVAGAAVAGAAVAGATVAGADVAGATVVAAGEQAANISMAVSVRKTMVFFISSPFPNKNGFPLE